ncbi:MAG: beta-lactamase family protein [Caldilineaceae bacterium]|nr:beta-lactamase family protein [Caldilineaceae bacterium]
MVTVIDQIDELFQPWANPASPGCALGIVQDGALVYARGYGMANLELGVPITPTSAFYLASMSKQFVGMAMLLLAEAGQLALTDDLRTYVPEVPDYGAQITLAHLLRHTSGLRDYLELGLLAGKQLEDVWRETAFLQSVARQKALNFAPGTQYLYSNTGYVLLSLVVKRVTGQALGTFAQEQIFAPLGMIHTVFKEHHQQLIPQRVSGYSANPNGGGFRNEYHNLQVAGDGGLYSTIHDLARWDANFYANRLGQGSPALIDLLYTTEPLTDGTPQSYALGLGHDTYRGLPIIKHGGGLNGARTQMIRYPTQRCTLICLSNLSSFAPEAMIRQVADRYLADQLGPVDAPADTTPPPTPPPTSFAIDAARLGSYAGRYESEELEATYWLTVQDGQLSLTYRNQDPIVLEATALDHFQDTSGRKLLFTRSATGEVMGFTLANWRVWNIPFERRK